jgi:hypothetical protein
MAKSAEYSKQQEGNATVFTVTPATPPKFVAAIGAGAVGVILGLGIISDMQGLAIFIIALGGYAIWYGLKRDLRPKGYKESATFRVTPETIEAAGKTFKKDDIHRILIRNGISDQEVSPGGGGMEITVSGAQAAGMMYRARVGTIANGLSVETGGKATIIAGGMDATTAFGLLTDVSRILGFSYREFA